MTKRTRVIINVLVAIGLALYVFVTLVLPHIYVVGHIRDNDNDVMFNVEVPASEYHTYKFWFDYCDDMGLSWKD